MSKGKVSMREPLTDSGNETDSSVFIIEDVHCRILSCLELFYLMNAICLRSSRETKVERAERKEKLVWILFMSRSI